MTVSRKTYAGVWGSLVVLTLLTAGIAYLDLGVLNPVAAITIAVIKMALVALFFMHLRYTRIRLTYVFTAAGLLWLALLMAFTWTDVITRHPIVPPPPWPANDVTSHMSIFKAK
ncbi:MAG TPA: cytochrome C oxidase subunit IV family protein [Candidatus Baltobacteraceae bacterium]|nr:cytochrome C oxidase subunit IV family protein [Candidatus Baltobacteraceae bacterium]